MIVGHKFRMCDAYVWIERSRRQYVREIKKMEGKHAASWAYLSWVSGIRAVRIRFLSGVSLIIYDPAIFLTQDRREIHFDGL